MKTNKLWPFLQPYAKIRLNLVRDLNAKEKTYIRNNRKKIRDLGMDKNILGNQNHE